MKNKKNKFRLTIIYILGFILAVATALPAYIQSNFLKQFVNLNYVSLFFIIANLITAIMIIFYPRIIKKFTNYLTTKTTLMFYLASLLGLFFSHNFWSVLISIIFFSLSSNLIWINMDLILESFSTNNETGKIRTSYLTFTNLGWVFAPNLSSYLIHIGNYRLVFLVSASIIIIFFLLFIREKNNLQDIIIFPKGNLKKDIKKIIQDRNLRGVFTASLLLNIFYSSAVVYIPIYLHQTLGMDWKSLGMIFSIMLIPFIIIEFPAGLIADKFLGEKEMMITGIGIISVSLFLFFYIDTPIVWLWTIILFLSRIGAALTESMRETYFFKIVDIEDMELINLFRTANPLGYVIGPALAILILHFLPIQYIFIGTALIMILGTINVTLIKDTK